MLYLFFGPEPYQKHCFLSKIQAKSQKIPYTEKKMIEISKGFDFSLLSRTQKQLSFFGEKKYLQIHLQNLNLSDSQQMKLIEFIDNTPKDDELVIFIENPKKNTFQLKWFVQLQQKADKIEKCYPLSGVLLKKWVHKMLAEKKISLSDNQINQLVTKSHGNVQLCGQTLEKIELLQTHADYSNEDFEQLILDNPKFKVFDLLNALESEDFQGTLRIFQTLIKIRTDPMLLIWGLTEYVQKQLQLHFRKHKTRLKERHLKALLRQLAELDRAIKMGLDLNLCPFEQLKLILPLFFNPIYQETPDAIC